LHVVPFELPRPKNEADFERMCSIRVSTVRFRPWPPVFRTAPSDGGRFFMAHPSHARRAHSGNHPNQDVGWKQGDKETYGHADGMVRGASGGRALGGTGEEKRAGPR